MLQLWLKVLYNFNVCFQNRTFFKEVSTILQLPIIKEVQHALLESVVTLATQQISLGGKDVELSYYYFKHYWVKLKTFFAIDTPYTVLGDKPHVNLWVFVRVFGD